jgi:hypothetical protein
MGLKEGNFGTEFKTMNEMRRDRVLRRKERIDPK